MRLAGVGPGDEVITSPYSFVASANCAIYEGATPVFADIDPRTFNLDPAAVEAAITERTKAIVAVDIFGYPCELDELRAICDRHGLALVEDACEALGARYKGRPRRLARPSGGLRVLSEQADDDGRGRGRDDGLRGGVTRCSSRSATRAGSTRARWLQHGRLGFNYRLDDISAALGIGQLEKLDEILAGRREVAARYAELLAGVDVEPPLADDADHVRSLVRLRRQAAGGRRPRRRHRARLRERGVATAPYLPSIHLQSYMRERFGFARGDAARQRGLQRAHARAAVPRPPRRDDQEYVVETLRAGLA